MKRLLDKKPMWPQLTLFWRLFLSLLFIILMTSALSITIERMLNERELATQMDTQIAQLLAQREPLVQALQAGDFAAVRQRYRDNRRFMSQIRVFDEQGAIIFPRYRERPERPNEPIANKMGHVDDSRASNAAINQPDATHFERHQPPSLIDNLLRPAPSHEAITDLNRRPELADMTVKLPDGQSVIIQLRPHLLFKDILAMQHGNLIVRLSIVILLSVLVCVWLSRTMTRRIRHVQHTVHRMMDGDYDANPKMSTRGVDELGLLANDVAQLSMRLADSELARKQMLSDISHELRSPLARLDVATELTRDFAPQASRYLDRIDKETARMNELIEHIIHIQSLQMQQYTALSADHDWVNMPELITTIGQDVCFEFQHKQITWWWQPPLDSLDGMAADQANLWDIKGNQEQLHSALENVIRNAFMHAPDQSTVCAAIAHTQTADGHQAIKIDITDEGGGVAEKDLTRIFQPFVRLDSARHRQTGGYGLGLAIVHAVVTAHSGQLRAHNRQDGVQGLVVTLIFKQP